MATSERQPLGPVFAAIDRAPVGEPSTSEHRLRGGAFEASLAIERGASVIDVLPIHGAPG